MVVEVDEDRDDRVLKVEEVIGLGVGERVNRW